jgi:hypothetical protein
MANKKDCSLKDTTELRKLILDNPDLPLVIFVDGDTNDGEYCYEQADVYNCSIQELALYKDVWYERDDFKEALSDDLCDREEYRDLSNEEYMKVIDDKVAEVEFVKAIVVYVG